MTRKKLVRMAIGSSIASGLAWMITTGQPTWTRLTACFIVGCITGYLDALVFE